jgi:hypothetical protein
LFYLAVEMGLKGGDVYVMLTLDALVETPSRDGKPLRLKDYERAIRDPMRICYEPKTKTFRMTDKPRRKDQPRSGR